MAREVDAALLDDEQALVQGDPRGVLRALATAGAQVREAVELAEDAAVTRVAQDGRPRAVVVASLGGSAVVADVLNALAGAGSPVPVSVRRGLPLPGWVGPLDLVVAVSLSGRAAGPLALAAEAARRGARLLTVGAVDSPLAQVCAQARGVHVPAGRGHSSSRTALWSMLVPVLLAADSLGLAAVPPSALEETAVRLESEADACRPSSESFVNPAKVLALELSAAVPLVLADGDLMAVAANRAVGMLARTARVPAAMGTLPYDASGVVATFGGPLAAGAGSDDVFADPDIDGPVGARLRLLLLLDADPSPAAGVPASLPVPGSAQVPGGADLASAVRATAQDAGVRVSEVAAGPGHPLARLAGTIARTDFTAAYLALGMGQDPATSPEVAGLRDRTDS